MNVVLTLSDETAAALEEIAAGCNLSPEGYVEMLVGQAILDARSSPALRLPAWMPRTRRSRHRDVDRASAQMRAQFLKLREEAVAAVARMNFLGAVMDRYSRRICEEDLKALRLLRAGERAEALQAFQRKAVYQRGRDAVREELGAATDAAAAMTQQMRQEQE